MLYISKAYQPDFCVEKNLLVLNLFPHCMSKFWLMVGVSRVNCAGDSFTSG